MAITDIPNSSVDNGVNVDALLGARGDRRVGEDRIEHGSPWRVQRVDAVGRLDVDRRRLVADVEGRAAHGRSPGRDDLRENAPAVELKDAAAHEGVRGQRVVPVLRTVDDEDIEPGAGKEQGGGGAGGASADDDRVVVVGTVSGCHRMKR